MSLLNVFLTKSGRMKTRAMVLVSWPASTFLLSWSPRINLIRLSLIPWQSVNCLASQTEITITTSL